METERKTGPSPLFTAKDYAAPSVFQPENLLREARRQKTIQQGSVPEVCVLDPDGDIVRAVQADGRGRRNPFWACYHTDMVDLDHAGETLGFVGCAVGAPFAVLVAEQMFAAGCRLLISVTSSGRIGDAIPDASFILIDRALRDEGTSLHYRPASRFAEADAALIRRIAAALADHQPTVRQGATWTTDAPFRETETAIQAAAAAGVLAVEMEAAALYAFAEARRQPVVCFAHVTNQMAQVDGDFEKGEANGTRDALNLIAATVKAWRGTT
jgi:uridine phosphorylase